MRITHGKIIPRDDGKRIEEVVGLATTGTPSMSVAKMLAPPGWREPFQTPEFDEVVVVSRGALTLVIGKRRERIAAGEVGLVPKGARVQYRNDETAACEYVSVCAPAFHPSLAHMEEAEPQRENVVVVTTGHPRARRVVKRVELLAQRFLRDLDLRGCELSVSLVGDTAIRRLNRAWRKKDKATDVLSFPAGEAPRGTPGPRLLGDVIISMDTAARVAREDGRPLEAELARYLAHGVLHLLGHDHHRKADARRMATLENQLLGSQGMLDTNEGVLTPAKHRREA